MLIALAAAFMLSLLVVIRQALIDSRNMAARGATGERLWATCAYV